MNLPNKRRHKVATIECLAVPLYTDDIDNARRIKKEENSDRIKNDGYYAIGRRVVALAFDGSVISDRSRNVRKGKKKNPRSIIKDTKHHQGLNRWMTSAVTALRKNGRQDLEVTGDFVPSTTKSSDWFDTKIFGYRSIDDYLLLRGLASALTQKKLGQYELKLATRDTMPGSMVTIGKDSQGIPVVEPSRKPIPPDWVALVGVGDGEKVASTIDFNESASVALMAFGSMRFAGSCYEYAMKSSIELATDPEVSLSNVSHRLLPEPK